MHRRLLRIHIYYWCFCYRVDSTITLLDGSHRPPIVGRVRLPMAGIARNLSASLPLQFNNSRSMRPRRSNNQLYHPKCTSLLVLVTKVKVFEREQVYLYEYSHEYLPAYSTHLTFRYYVLLVPVSMSCRSPHPTRNNEVFA